ncbi:substrate-binding domain-containing protein [Ammonicoccus fulvus]|uniref:Substrate-binding domain-containing protein n=1 Tax=Ammonicoccus fulvus TaxID=3138240 RepID=A0ABZ3FKY9_9ACTN
MLFRFPLPHPRRLGAGLIGVSLVLALSGCPATPSAGPGQTGPTPDPAYACPAGDLLIEGNPTDQTLVETRAADYSAMCRNAGRLLVSAARDAGTSSFLNGLVHISAADSPLDATQQEQAKVRCLSHPAWHLPVTVDPVALVYRIDGVTDLTLRPETLAKVFSGIITHWNDADIVADNPGVRLPAQRIEVVPRSGRTGLTEAVGSYLSREAPAQWTVGANPAWRGQGQARATAQEVLDTVSTTPGALAYVEYSQLTTEVLSPTPTPGAGTPNGESAQSPGATPTAGTTASPRPPASSTPALVRLLRNDAPVALTPTSADAAVQGMRAWEGPDLVVDPASLGEAPGAWPIHRVSYQVLCSAGMRADVTALEKDWLTYLVDDNTQSTFAEEGRIALPAPLRDRVRQSVAALR